ncbi:MAG: hypothetical protein ACK417_12130 [Bacteroidia bacterium]|jgi:Skp family chaperone for outer membrane proteins
MKKLIAISLFLFVASSSMAQQRTAQEELKAARIGYITQALALTETEAQQFWPVYNKYDAARDAHRKKMRALRLTDGEEVLSEQNAERAIAAYLDLRAEELVLEQQFYKDILKVLPAEKAARLIRAEKGFQRDVLRQMHHRREPLRGRR